MNQQQQFPPQPSLFLWLEASPLKSISLALTPVAKFLFDFFFSFVLLFKSWLPSKMGGEMGFNLEDR